MQQSRDLPFTPAQERDLIAREWIEIRGRPAPAFNFVNCRRIRGALNPALFSTALNLLAARHVALRSTVERSRTPPSNVRRTLVAQYARTGVFEEGLYRQRVVTRADVPLTCRDIRHLPDYMREHEVRRACMIENSQPFELSVPPLCRARLLTTGDNEHVIVLSIPHHAADAISIGICWNDLFNIYERLEHGRPHDAERPATGIHDFIAAQRHSCEHGAHRRSVDYWVQRWSTILADSEITADDLDIARSGSWRVSVGTSVVRLYVDSITTERIKRACRRNKVSPACLFLAAYCRLLHLRSGRPVIAPLIPVANRTHPFSATVGWLVNSHAVGVHVEDCTSAQDLVGRTRDALVQALNHREVPLQWVWRHMGTPDLAGKRRLLFNYSRVEPVQRLGGLTIDAVADALVPLPSGRGFDVWVVEHEAWFALYGMFSVGHFTPDNAALLLDQFMAVLSELIEGVAS